MRSRTTVLFIVVIILSGTFFTGCSLSEEESNAISEVVIAENSETLLSTKRGVLLTKYLNGSELDALGEYNQEYEKKMMQELKRNIRTYAKQEEVRDDAEMWLKFLLYYVGADYEQLHREIDQFKPTFEVGLLPTFQTVEEFYEEGKQEKKLNVFFILDVSDETKSFVSNQENIQFLKQTFTHFSRQLPEKARISLQVFGYKNEEETSPCENVSTIYPLKPYQEDEIKKVISTIQRGTEAPFTKALTKTEEVLEKEADSKNFVYIVSSGVDTCNQDPLQVAERLNRENTEIYFFGFRLHEANEKQLQTLAKKSGGYYIDIKDANELLATLEKYQPIVMDENQIHGPTSQEVIEQQLLFQEKEELYQYVASNELNRLYDAIDYMSEKQLLDDSVMVELKELVSNRGMLIKETWNEINMKKNEEILLEKERLEEIVEMF